MTEPQDMDMYFKGHNLDVASIINAFWRNRESEESTEQLCHLLSRYLVEKNVFDEIEFYIPQIAHMIIHFGSSNKKLWKLMIMICQVSMHSALLLSFIFYAAMEDFQPEDSSGVENEHRDAALHTHCAHLLSRIEKVVLLGSPSVHELVTSSNHNDKNALEIEELEAESRILDSELIISMDKEDQDVSLMSGKLLYKRVEKKSMFVRKMWKPRYFRIENKVLQCYRDDQYSELLRSTPLQDCRVMEVHNPHHHNCFEVHSPITFTVFKLQAESRQEMLKWVDGINSVVEALPHVHSGSVSDGNASKRQSVQHGDTLYDVSTEQKNRFTFFLEQRRFVESLTRICEDLRFMDPKCHKAELQKRLCHLQVPGLCYLNLCRSSEVWTRVVNVLPDEAHAFKTKARVPTLLLFEMQSHLNGHDVATFLNEEVGEAMTLFSPREKDSSPAPAPADIPDKTFQTVFRTSSKSTLKTRRLSMWSTGSMSNIPSSTDSESAADAVTESDVHDQALQEEQEVGGKAGETFAQKAERIRVASPFGHLEGWKLDGLICKSNDDLRQEVFVMQMIKYFIRIFQAEKVPVWLLSYTIMSTSQTTGLIELIPNAQSLDAMKKSSYWPGSLRSYFEKTFGPEGSGPFQEAVDAYTASLAGYSVVCYILAIKDRHNGNIMMDNRGRLIHIDYGFVFGIAPGKKFSMETAPWKLTEEMVEVMGGINSTGYQKFVALTIDAMRAVRKYTNEFLGLMEILAYKSNYPAFSYNPNAMIDLRDRMMPEVSDENLPAKVKEMMAKCYKHSGAIRYDKFQVLTNGIAR